MNHKQYDPHYRVSLIFLLICVSLAACDQRKELPLTPLQLQFQQQIQLTCESTEKKYEKSATNLNDSATSTETQVFDLDSTSTQNDTCILFNELRYAVEKVYDDPKLKEIFTFEENGDTTIARVKPENATSSNLQLQKILQDQEIIRYIETVLVQDSWLYQTNIHMYVYFDSMGNYVHHMIESRMRVSTISESFNANIVGKLITND